MANFPLEAFKSNLPGGGARANHFDVHMHFPSGIGIGSGQSQHFKFLTKAASLPASTIGEVPVQFRGRILKLAGDRTYDDWETTIYNDTNFAVRDVIERWSDQIESAASQLSSAWPNYTVQAEVHQLDRDGVILKTYQFHGMWPGTVSTIELDYGTNDEVETFTVTWKYNYWTTANTRHEGLVESAHLGI